MKKNNELYCFVAILMIAFSLVNMCFYDNLWLLVFICYNLCVFCTVCWARQNYKSIKAYLPFFILMVFAVLYFIVPMKEMAVKMNWCYYLDERNKVIEDIRPLINDF